MMRQLEIQYFYPLTEQIALDLDFSPCVKFAEEKYKSQVVMGLNGTVLTCGGTGLTWATTASNIQPSFTIDVDQTPITIVSTKKPNIIKRWVYKTLGMKWKPK